MILTHCLLHVFRQDGFDCPTGPFENFREDYFFLFRKGLQNVMLGSHLFARSTDPQTNPLKTGIAQMIFYGHQPSMSAMTATLL